MVPGAVNIAAVLSHARILAKVVRVVFQFFPTMGFLAVQPIGASVCILNYLVYSVPSCALLRSIHVLVRLSAIVLPVMGVYAYLSLVVLFLVWTPYCFEVVHVKVSVPLESLDQVD